MNQAFPSALLQDRSGLRLTPIKVLAAVDPERIWGRPCLFPVAIAPVGVGRPRKNSPL